jgi:hypothetical protein
MTADDWVNEVAIKIVERVPDAMVDHFRDGCLAIVRGRTAVAVSATDSMALVNVGVGQSGAAPRSAFPLGEPFTFGVNTATVESAALRIASLIVQRGDQ